MPQILKKWFPLALCITCLAGLLMLLTQQVLRLMADDPQIELAEDMSLRLARGADPRTILTQPAINLRTSVSTYVMVFNEQMQPIVVTAILDNQNVQPPAAVFETTKQHGQTRFTWQPEYGVKSATVMNYFADQQIGYVLVGRSLRETDNRILEVRESILAGWLMIMALTLATTIVFDRVPVEKIRIKFPKSA